MNLNKLIVALALLLPIQTYSQLSESEESFSPSPQQSQLDIKQNDIREISNTPSKMFESIFHIASNDTIIKINNEVEFVPSYVELTINNQTRYHPTGNEYEMGSRQINYGYYEQREDGHLNPERHIEQIKQVINILNMYCQQSKE